MSLYFGNKLIAGQDILTLEQLGGVPLERTINNKPLSDNITLSAADVGARPDTWTPTASDVGASNRNLLHNWYFPRPVNQRGQTSYTSDGYTIDGWKKSSAVAAGTIVLDANGLSYIWPAPEAYLDFEQKLEDYLMSAITGETITFSIDINGTINSFTWVFGVDIYKEGLYTNVDFFSLSALGFHPIVRFIGGDINGIRRAKLELGSVSTLANDPPPDFGEQLTVCKRFYRLWTTAEARTEALKEVGLMRLASPTTGTISIGGTTYYYASADL